MTAPTILLLLVSFSTLVLGLFAWRLTSSRPLILNMLFGSFAFLIAAYAIATRNPGQLTVIIPFFASMLLAGRAGGTYWRAFFRGEKELRLPSHFVGIAAVLCVLGTVVAFMNQ